MGRARLTLLYPEDSLAGAMVAFSRSQQAVLPVVDGDRRLKGVLKRADLLAHYADKVLGEQEEILHVRSGEDAPGLEVGLGKGLVIERLVVGSWAGKTLRELDLRGKTAVSVLEWARDRETVAVDPRRRLREADELAVCGTRDPLLRLRALK